MVRQQRELGAALPNGFYDQVWCSRIYAWSCQAAALIARLAAEKAEAELERDEARERYWRYREAQEIIDRAPKDA